MKLLLDTHVWLWCLMEPARLSRKSRRLLTEKNSELYLSSISVWESLILAERGRISIGDNPRGFIEDALALVPCDEIPVTVDIALASRSLNLPHQDPADRFIAATAIVFDVTLMTADARLLAGDGYATLPA